MVYCTKCGTKNEEDAEVCVKCGAPLVTQPPWRHARQRTEEECFGLPYGGAIAGTIIGIIIILVGLSLLPGFDIGRYIGAVLVIIIGILIVAGALYRYSRRY
jgi:uncharacterized membrane protein YvbJ